MSSRVLFEVLCCLRKLLLESGEKKRATSPQAYLDVNRGIIPKMIQIGADFNFGNRILSGHSSKQLVVDDLFGGYATLYMSG